MCGEHSPLGNSFHEIIKRPTPIMFGRSKGDALPLPSSCSISWRQMPAIAPDNSFLAKQDVVSRPLEKGALLVDLSSGDCWELNQVGAAIWDSLIAGKTVTETVDGLSAVHKISRAIIEADAIKLCESLVTAGLLVLTKRRRNA